jgi:hypothetical protein
MITQGISPSGFKSISDAYDRLQEESKAMVRYFQFMKDKSLLKLFVHVEWLNIPQHFVKPDVDQWISIMKQDYLILGGVLDNKRAPIIKRSDGEDADRPFLGGDATRRDPAKGFLDIPRSLSENADEELAFSFSFHGITPNRPTTILEHVIQTICYGIMATNNVIWSCDVSSFQIKSN